LVGEGEEKKKKNLDDPVAGVSVRSAVVAEGRGPAVQAEHVALVARGRRVDAAGQEEARPQQRLQPLRRPHHQAMQCNAATLLFSLTTAPHRTGDKRERERERDGGWMDSVEGSVGFSLEQKLPL
jgi:hypothetical protein